MSISKVDKLENREKNLYLFLLFIPVSVSSFKSKIIPFSECIQLLVIREKHLLGQTIWCPNFLFFFFSLSIWVDAIYLISHFTFSKMVKTCLILKYYDYYSVVSIKTYVLLLNNSVKLLHYGHLHFIDKKTIKDWLKWLKLKWLSASGNKW